MSKSINEYEKNKYKDIIKNAVASESTRLRQSSEEMGVASIVRGKTGSFVICKEMLAKLNNPIHLQISYTVDCIIIAEELDNNNNYLDLKIRSKRGAIYSYLLVNEIERIFELHFSGRTTITFKEVIYVMNDKYPVAVIKVK